MAGFACHELYTTNTYSRQNPRVLICICDDLMIRVINLENYQIIQCISNPEFVFSSAISPTHGRYFLFNMDFLAYNSDANEENQLKTTKLNLYDVKKEKILATYRGFAQTKYQLRPCFAGPNESIVAIGSEGKFQYIFSSR